MCTNVLFLALHANSHIHPLTFEFCLLCVLDSELHALSSTLDVIYYSFMLKLTAYKCLSKFNRQLYCLGTHAQARYMVVCVCVCLD